MADRTFESVTPLADARDRLREWCSPHGRTEPCALRVAAGRILAADTTADRAVPHYDRVAMEGYAVRAQDTFDASARSPVPLQPSDERVAAGAAVPVHTGDPLPAGADAVVVLEHTEQRDGSVLVSEAVAGGENVTPAGDDIEADEHLFSAGHRLSPSDISLLQAAGREAVEVSERPRVSVLPTGEGVVPAGETPDAGAVVETNGLLVSSLVERWGGQSIHRDIVPAERAALWAAIEADLDHDIVVAIGGSSVGPQDHLPAIVEERGTLLVHGVAISPGHPIGFGVVDGTLVVLLPGYPVCSLVGAVQFLRPAVAWQAGTEPPAMPTTTARLETKLRSAPGERTFARVRLTADLEGVPSATPVRVGGADIMSSVTRSDGWVEVPDSREGIPAGEKVTVEHWEPTTGT
jgi:molybdopterin molybdotransferase